eukprot:TRINITY_DN3197_c0_g1_i1.p1 TRINITY_DN3197_c0_g1~~TRINITY_DN3197_c0_g1_i1.p1  ORF type:complete len:279 (+),score=35.41 TRINITY_DN3197_c0_g1_i1:1119-1955(+)
MLRITIVKSRRLGCVGRQIDCRSGRRLYSNPPTPPKDEPVGPLLKVAARDVSAKEATARGMQFERQRLIRKLGLNSPSSPPSASLPAQTLYSSKAGSLWYKFNSVMALGAFPVHAWGFYVLPDTSLLLYPVAFSLMWIWYSHRKATGTVTALELIAGHRQLRIETFDFFGRKKSQIVDRLMVAPVFVDASTTDLKELPEHLSPNSANPKSPQDMQILAALLSNHRIGGIEVYSDLKKRPARYDVDIKSMTSPDLILKLNQFARENAILVNQDQPLPSK